MYGVIDIGSNTIRLVIYRVCDGKIVPTLNSKYSAGLAAYITSRGKMSAAGIRKCTDILTELTTVAERIELESLYAFATASIRNITNTEEVLAAVRAACGLEIKVLSGHDEAVFDYYGAIQSTPMESGLLADVGGGSTEIVIYRERRVIFAASIPLGSLNLYDEYVDDILPGRKELFQIEKEVRRRIHDLRFPPSCDTHLMCAVGGTARAAAKLRREMLPTAEIEYDKKFLRKVLLQSENSPKKLASKILRAAPDRVHTLLPGITVLAAVADEFGCRNIVTSAYGVREGYLYHILQENGKI